MSYGHGKEIVKLTFQGLALRQGQNYSGKQTNTQYATNLWENKNSSRLKIPKCLQFLKNSNIQIYCQNSNPNIRLGIYLSPLIVIIIIIIILFKHSSALPVCLI